MRAVRFYRMQLSPQLTQGRCVVRKFDMTRRVRFDLCKIARTADTALDVCCPSDLLMSKLMVRERAVVACNNSFQISK